MPALNLDGLKRQVCTFCNWSILGGWVLDAGGGRAQYCANEEGGREEYLSWGWWFLLLLLMDDGTSAADNEY